MYLGILDFTWLLKWWPRYMSRCHNLSQFIIQRSWLMWHTLCFFSADCTWDFFSCTNKFGTWPDNKLCCEERFDTCCEKVNGGGNKKKKVTKPETSSSTSKPADNSSGGEGLQLSKISNYSRLPNSRAAFLFFFFWKEIPPTFNFHLNKEKILPTLLFFYVMN